MSAATKELTEYVKRLRNAAPQEFSNFTAAFEKYTDAVVYALVSTTGDLPLARGQAQQCVNLLRILEEVKNG
jgi:hypothetical protein